MRYSRTASITVSEDDNSNPKKIRFQEKEQEVLDVGSSGVLKEVKTGDINLPTTVTFEIPLGAIGTAQWFYLYADKSFKLKLNNGSEMVMKANRPHEMWMTFTKIEIVTTDVTRITYAVGGE